MTANFRSPNRPSPQPSLGHSGRRSQAAILGFVAAYAGASFAAAAPTPDEIDKAIAKGVSFLYTLQQPDGTWDIPTATLSPEAKATAARYAYKDLYQPGAATALAVHALREAGAPPTEPKLAAAIASMRDTPSQSTYTLSLRCQVWAGLPATDAVRAALRRDAAALLALRQPTEDGGLLWPFAQQQGVASPALNNVQSAAWGLWAAADAGYEIPPDVWKRIEKTFLMSQFPDGGWGWTLPTKKTPKLPEKMYDVATGVSALLLAQDYSRADAFATPRGNPDNPAIDRGMGWIATNLAKSKEDNELTDSPHRRWFGVGTVALASGLRRLGGEDWYALGAADLLGRQATRVGSWGSRVPAGDYRLNNTAWAILFLQRGRVPVGFNKFNYASGSVDPAKAFWNQRPRDAANAAAWVGRAMERELRWQIIDANDSVDAMLESPVLYLAGSNVIDLKPEVKAKLKTYVESGGLIFAAAEGSSVGFAKSVEKLATELFAGNEWRDVPDTHPLFANQMFKRATFKNKPSLRAIGNGVREFVLLAPTGDPGRTWQQRSGKINTDNWQLAANVLSYAVDKSHFYSRGESWLVTPSKRNAPVTLRIGRLNYGRAWDPEPMAFSQFKQYADTRGIGVQVTTIAAGEAIQDIDCLYVTGTAAFTLDDATRTAIKTYLDNGGRVFFEAAGGNAAFAASAQAELTRWYGADAINVLPANHKLYGEKLKVAYRNYNSNSIERLTEPQLRGVEKEGRVVAILSREDLTAGLLGVPTDGITGYTPDAARALLGRVLTKWK